MPNIVMAVLSELVMTNWFGTKRIAVLYAMKITTVGKMRLSTVPFQ